TIVDAVVGSPGTPKSTEVISPVVAVTAVIPRRNAKASTADILNTKGSISAIAVGPPRPGKMPTTKPITMPIIITLKVDQLKVNSRPATKALIISMIIYFLEDSSARYSSLNINITANCKEYLCVNRSRQ